jgi:alpha-L-fucosidase 2
LKQVRVVPINGTMRQDGNTLVLENTTEFMLFTVGGTNYYQDRNPQVLDTAPYLQFNFFRNREEAFGEIESRLAFAMDVGYNYLLRTHIQDFNGMMGRLDFRLDTVAGAPPERTTEMLMLNYLGEGPLANTESENRYVEILKFQLGRYLLLSSSREGSLPANLQGVWAAGIHPPWEADYHTNVNLQMNYWLAGPTNLIETQIPLIEWLEAQVARGSFTASWYHARPANRTQDGELRPVRGWVLYHINNIWAHTGPENFFEAAFAPNGGAWLATHIWEHFMFTQDVDFLRRYYDVLAEAALFWVDNLWIDTRDGYYVSNPSKSPERGPYTLGSTADMGIIWEILDNAIRANQALGGAAWRPNDAAELAEMISTLANLRPPQIGRTGYFMEWRDESWMDQHGRYHYTHSRWGPAAPHANRPPAEHSGWDYVSATTHRHNNHLHMLHPGTRIVPGRSPEEDMWARAMGVTLDTRRHDDANTGWSAAWRINFNARLHNGDLAYNMFRVGLQQRTFPNLLSFHPPFQIDGNLGTTAGVAEMLMQSHGGWIELIPAIPRDTYWRGGFVRGLLARGNTEVDIRWSEGMLNFAKFRPRLSGELEISYPNLDGTTLTKGGASVPFTVVEGTNRIRFNAVAGEEYLLVTPHGANGSIDFDILIDEDTAAMARDREAANFVQLTGLGDEHHNPGLQYIRLGANNYVSHVSTGAWIRWNNVDLRGGVVGLTGDFARGDASMITLALDVRAVPTGGAFEDAVTIGQFMTAFDSTGDWYAGREVDGTVTDLAETHTGRHDIFLFMIGTGYNFGGIQLKTLPPE